MAESRSEACSVFKPRRGSNRGSAGLEIDGHAAAHRAGGLNEIDGLAVLAYHRHIALRKQVTQVDERLHVCGQKTQRRNGLADENIKEGIALSRGGVEHIYGSQCRTTHPAIGSDPASVGAGRSAAELRR